ncbi:MAG: hypothetical protein ACJAU0_001618 [Flavobacteriales bacterium]|jgi:hypothetical protein
MKKYISVSTIILSLIFLPFNLLLAQQWTQIGSDIDGEDAFNNSGHSISMNDGGTSLIIGAPGNGDSFSGAGHARVYELNNGTWQQKGADIDGEAEYDGSGISVAMNAEGNIVAVGAVSNSDGGSGAGHIKVYEWNGDAWVQKGTDIDGDAAYSESGNAIEFSSDGNTLVIGASKSDVAASNAGHVRVYEWDTSDWVQKGLSMNGDDANNSFGYAVSISSDGNCIGIGSPLNSGGFVQGGQVKVFEWNGSAWNLKGTALYGADNFDLFGFSVSLSADGNTIAIGAIMHYNLGADVGHVRVYKWESSAWEQKGADIDGEAADDNSGSSLSISNDGNILAIGARGNDGTFGFNSVAGHVRVYLWYNDAWAQFGDDIDGESDSDFSGQSVALSADGSSLAIGADWNSGNGTSSGHVRVWAAPIFVNIAEKEFTSAIQLYPNPTNGSFFINFNQMYSGVEILVRNTLGQIISTNVYSSIQTAQVELIGQTGIYFVEVRSKESMPVIFRLMKE